MTLLARPSIRPIRTSRSRGERPSIFALRLARYALPRRCPAARREKAAVDHLEQRFGFIGLFDEIERARLHRLRPPARHCPRRSASTAANLPRIACVARSARRCHLCPACGNRAATRRHRASAHLRETCRRCESCVRPDRDCRRQQAVQRSANGIIVIDQIDVARHSSISSNAGRVKRKRRSPTRSVFRDERPAMGFDDPPRDREADSHRSTRSWWWRSANRVARPMSAGRPGPVSLTETSTIHRPPRATR